MFVIEETNVYKAIIVSPRDSMPKITGVGYYFLEERMWMNAHEFPLCYYASKAALCDVRKCFFSEKHLKNPNTCEFETCKLL